MKKQSWSKAQNWSVFQYAVFIAALLIGVSDLYAQSSGAEVQGREDDPRVIHARLLEALRRSEARQDIARLDKLEAQAVVPGRVGPVADNSPGGFGGVVRTSAQYPTGWVNGVPSWLAGSGVKNYWLGFYFEEDARRNRQNEYYQPEYISYLRGYYLQRAKEKRDGYTGPYGVYFNEPFTGMCVAEADRLKLGTMYGPDRPGIGTALIYLPEWGVNQFYHWDVSIPKIDILQPEFDYSPNWDCSYFFEATGINRFLKHYRLEDKGIDWLYPSRLTGGDYDARQAPGCWYINIQVGYEGSEHLFIQLTVYDGDAPRDSHGNVYQVQGFYLSAYYVLEGLE